MTMPRSLFVLSIASLLVGLSSSIGLNQASAAPPDHPPRDLAQPPGRPGEQSDRPSARPSPPNFAAAADELGVSESELLDALGLDEPPDDADEPPSGPPPRLDIEDAAEKLGVTEEELTRALRLPAHPPAEGHRH